MALEKCAMKEAVLAMPEKLRAPVSEYGENISQGQRQLLCLGRALLKQCKILLLDEATSSVDFETDRAIQTTLRQSFPGCTVLTVSDIPCEIRREGGQSLVIEGPSLVIGL